MAPNRRAESEAPQHEASSEEEEEEEENSSGSSEEEEPPQYTTTTSAPKKPLSIPTSSAPTKPQPTSHSSESESETNSEYESDSDSPPTTTTATTTTTTAAIIHRPDPNIKPISSKPMQDPKPTKKPRSDPTPSTPPPKSAASAAKRPAAEIQSNGGPGDSKAKRKKKGKDVTAVINNGNSGIQTKPGKQNMFQRLWSEDDEIAILKGLLDFRAKEGFDPMTDLNAFHDFVRKSLRCGDVSSSQFSTKVRRMKRKFENNANKKGKDGVERSFKNPHEQRLYDLSKKIWGEDSEGFGAESAKKRRKTKKGLSEELEEGANAGAIGLGSSVEEMVMKEGLELIGGSSKAEMMEKWRQYRVEEVELYVKKLGLVTEQAKLVLEALRKGRF